MVTGDISLAATTVRLGVMLVGPMGMIGAVGITGALGVGYLP